MANPIGRLFRKTMFLIAVQASIQLLPNTASAQLQFDGTWEGRFIGLGHEHVTVWVTDNKFKLYTEWSGTQTLSSQGEVRRDGAIRSCGTYQRSQNSETLCIEGKFSGQNYTLQSFSGRWSVGSANGDVTLKRSSAAITGSPKPKSVEQAKGKDQPSTPSIYPSSSQATSTAMPRQAIVAVGDFIMADGRIADRGRQDLLAQLARFAPSVLRIVKDRPNSADPDIVVVGRYVGGQATQSTDAGREVARRFGYNVGSPERLKLVVQAQVEATRVADGAVLTEFAEVTDKVSTEADINRVGVQLLQKAISTATAKLMDRFPTDLREFIAVSVIKNDEKRMQEAAKKEEEIKTREAAKKEEDARKQEELRKRQEAQLRAETENKRKMTEEAQLKNEAPDFMSDTQDFIKRGASSIDLVEAAVLFGRARPTQQGGWSNELQVNYLALKGFMLKSEDFKLYRNQQEELRLQNRLAQAEDIIGKLRAAVSVFEDYLKKNFGTRQTERVANLVKLAQENTNTNDLFKLSAAWKLIEVFAREQNLEKAILDLNVSRRVADQSSGTLKSNTPVGATLAKRSGLLEGPIGKLIEEGDPSDILVLMNVSGSAPNALINLQGRAVFEGQQAVGCRFQSKAFESDRRWYLYNQVKKQYNINKINLDDPCSSEDLTQVDLVVFKRSDILALNELVVTPLFAQLREKKLSLLVVISNASYLADVARRGVVAEQIENEIQQGIRIGFGALALKNDNAIVCAVGSDGDLGLQTLIQEFGDEFERAMGKTLGETAFSNVDVAFSGAQRGRCGLLFGSEKALEQLMQGLKRTSIGYVFLPKWSSNADYEKVNKDQKGIEQAKIQSEEQRRQEIERERKLSEERAKSYGIDSQKRQVELREKNGVRVRALSQDIEIKIKDTIEGKANWIVEMHRELKKWLADRASERWEFESLRTTIDDYGLGTWGNRRIESVVINAEIKMKNRAIGQYETTCFSLGQLIDSEFSMIRSPYMGSCADANSRTRWKTGQKFESGWVVQ